MDPQSFRWIHNHSALFLIADQDRDADPALQNCGVTFKFCSTLLNENFAVINLPSTLWFHLPFYFNIFVFNIIKITITYYKFPCIFSVAIVIIFAHLEPDPHSKSGSRRKYECGS